LLRYFKINAKLIFVILKLFSFTVKYNGAKKPEANKKKQRDQNKSTLITNLYFI